MSIKNKQWKIIASSLLFLALQPAAHAVDSMSVEFGTGNKTKSLAVGAQWDWNKQWWQSNGTHLGGYWDLSLAQWRGTRYQNMLDTNQNITDIGITPMFRFQADSKTGPYVEAGIGAHVLSHAYNNNGRRLSTAFEFGDRLGVGYVFANKLDIGLSFEHFSNGGIKQPNNGVNFGLVKVKYAF